MNAAQIMTLLGIGALAFLWTRRAEASEGYAQPITGDIYGWDYAPTSPLPFTLLPLEESDLIGWDYEIPLTDQTGFAPEGFLPTTFGTIGWRSVASLIQNARYVALAHSAEARYGIPYDMIVRLIYQESRFRPDIISGATISSAGAVGIMQLVPRWHPGSNPLDPASAIDYGAKYLAGLKQQFGSWNLALQAYNTGPGNLQKILTGTMALPTETRNYSAQILADIGMVVA